MAYLSARNDYENCSCSKMSLKTRRKHPCAYFGRFTSQLKSGCSCYGSQQDFRLFASLSVY